MQDKPRPGHQPIYREAVTGLARPTGAPTEKAARPARPGARAGSSPMNAYRVISFQAPCVIPDRP